MNNQLLKMLDDKKIEYQLIEHPAVYTMEEMEQLNLPDFELVAKNLFLRNDKKTIYYLIVVKEDRKINLKQMRKQYQTRPLSFASKEDLEAILKTTPGSVTPFGVLEDTQCKVVVWIDDFFEGKTIGVHPNTNEATIWIESKTLQTILKEHNNSVEFIDFKKGIGE
ncbi:prolyl-tRNA synthetase associated domain-containing protein [Tannockella kyphosi]|uniref:prolyl-tRNA synthetase associated domain-containing protein n=1 Tax=Tannockella kyphosi TaxID=2899121 RepID=UPI0020136A5B|nr:prolyl-tRNA synthetase associated domain-containing protein [Tannockella kyphosi]